MPLPSPVWAPIRARLLFQALLMDMGCAIRFVSNAQIVDVSSWRLWL